MADSEPTWTHWAVLIGVGVSIDTISLSQGDQQSRPRDRSLKGAVPDIAAVNDYLGSQSKVKITKLTATKPSDEDTISAPIEAPGNLPTLDNVCSVLQDVIEEGMRGQSKHVYIHFSGHGTRIGSEGPFALVLYHDSARGARYLRSTELANALDLMTKNGMHVTLVLDCCFSGGVVRTDELRGSDIRFIEYDPVVDAESNAGNRFGREPRDNTRDSVLKLDRLLDPKGYTIITACGPNETSSEIEFQNGARRGALSYFLDYSLRSLRKGGARITHQSLYQYLQARFHARYPQQTPMRYGSTDISFFQGLMDGPGIPFVAVFRNAKDGRLILSAGQAHGVHEKDEYDAYSYFASEDPKHIPNQKSIKMQVQTVENLTSDLVVVDPADAKRIASGPTWKAKPLTSFSPRKIPMRLMPSLPDLDREQLLRDAQSHSFLQLSAEERETESSLFNVILNTENDYEVQDGALNKIPSLPTIPRDSYQALNTLTTRLGHLATFKFFESMENQEPDPAFEGSFLLQAEGSVGQDGWLELKHQSSWKLTVKNLSESLIYLVIFNFRPSWEVCNVVWEAEGGDFLQIPPRHHPDSEIELALSMEVPDFVQAADQQQCEDIMKIFVTSKSTSFPGIILPKLRDGSMRSNPDQLSNFLGTFIRGFCETRSDGHQGKWATQNFLIRTSM
ncbi:uncharacterized protein PAC_14638 [Phialocephala subalpina]|uniref:Peptidase C14 caspase domain-containing protein n=1 Tax=Phialocephala subalpina TaxID=576137 RepID=A0A1L7XI64_9HELO|nr:uncharacterized protein PAC_14638 [Phialocephala subalpina]